MSATSRTVLFLALAGAPAVAACASAARSAEVTTRPRLTALVPDSVRLITGNVTEVELRGSSFDATANTVRVGSVEVTPVRSSANGTRILFVIPDHVASGGEAPPARWMSGRYPVTVRTALGISDTLMLAIAAGGGLQP